MNDLRMPVIKLEDIQKELVGEIGRLHEIIHEISSHVGTHHAIRHISSLDKYEKRIKLIQETNYGDTCN